MKNIFEPAVVEETIERLNKLVPHSKPIWGKMNAAQMLAHLNVAYEMAFENKHEKPNFLMQFILRTFVKKTVCGPKPYPKNSPTAPAFKVMGPRDFNREKARLIEYLQRSAQYGESYFEGKASNSFGKLTALEWNVMFYKHIDHHFQQFGV